MRILLGLALLTGNCVGQAYGINALHSTFTGETQPKSVTLRIEKHLKGEVLTLDRVDGVSRSL